MQSSAIFKDAAQKNVLIYPGENFSAEVLHQWRLIYRLLRLLCRDRK